jgi:hypothetical protein
VALERAPRRKLTHVKACAALLRNRPDMTLLIQCVVSRDESRSPEEMFHEGA